MKEIPRIGISLGDPAGIGPEIIVKTFAASEKPPRAAYLIFGSAKTLAQEAEVLGLPFAPLPAAGPGDLRQPGLYLLDAGPSGEGVVKGRPSSESGRVSFAVFERAVEEARQGRLTGIVTAPISKTAWSMAGLKWRGHTDYLTKLYPGAIMSFWSDRLRVALLSHHVPLRDALARVKADILLDFFFVLRRSLARHSSRTFRFLVAGLNPHAGEDGLMGDDEDEIALAVGRARAAGMDIEGPCPPDTVFRRALGQDDMMVVALYHDQGLIPFKLEAFESGVNVTLGLPFLRTSPDHGTAFDIAPSRKADPTSFRRAVELAVEFAGARSL
jgi:4-hydroxythreonine-4-phosphate dehydrogenase